MNSPKEIANNYIAIGKGKVNTPVAKMFVLGILAGIFIAFGGVASTAAAVSIPLASVQVSWSMHLPRRTDYGTPRWK